MFFRKLRQIDLSKLLYLQIIEEKKKTYGGALFDLCSSKSGYLHLEVYLNLKIKWK